MDRIAAFAAALSDGQPDVVVQLDGAGLERVAALARDGARYVVAVSGADAAAAEAARELPGAVVIAHYEVEGSLLQLEEEAPGAVAPPPEAMTALVVAGGFERERLEAALREAGGALHAAGVEAVRVLERANAELALANRRLARSWLGRTDAAAAAVLARLDEENARLRATLEVREARIEELTIVAKRNDDLYQQEVKWHDARRYHAVDWVRDRLLAVKRVFSRRGSSG
jgi:cell division septum initiation protein DivIVA